MCGELRAFAEQEFRQGGSPPDRLREVVFDARNSDANPGSRWRVTSVKRAAHRWLPTHSTHQPCHLSPLRPVRSEMIERGFSFSRGRRCGGDLWRGLLQSEQVAKQVASAPVRGGRRCGGDLWRHPHQSEQVARQVASAQIRVPDVPRCERSEHREPSEPWMFEFAGRSPTTIGLKSHVIRSDGC